MCCRNSIGIAENPEEAAKYFLFAAANNYCDAIYRFGVCKIKGYGTQLDQELGAAFIFDASRKILEEPDTLYWTLTHPKGNAKLSGRLHLEAIKSFANWYLFGHIDQTDPVTFRQYLADMQKNYHRDAVNRFENGTLRPDPDCDFISYEEKFANAASSKIKSYIDAVVTYNSNRRRRSNDNNTYFIDGVSRRNNNNNKYDNNLPARYIRYAPYFLTYAALRGVAEFQYMLSVFYTDGFGIELVPAFAPAGLNFWKDIMWKTDSHFAHYFLTEAAKNGMPVAQYELALQFIKEKNKDQAVEMLKKAAAKDFAPAKLRLAQQTDDEAVLEEFFNSDPQNALKIAGFYELDGNADARLKWLLKGAEQNVLQAIYQLGKDCIARKKPDEAQVHFDNAAAQSHAMALEIGKYYLLELKKTEEAKAFLEKAALSDDKELIFNIAACYSKYPAIRDVVKEVELLTRASDLLHPAAQFELAKIYLFGKGDITASTEQGIKLLQDSADNGFPAAQNLYAKFLAEGDFGLKINLIKAVEYLKKAVEQNNGDACFTLAQCLFTGNWKFDKDEEEALRMLYRGANNGGKEAARQFANYIMFKNCADQDLYTFEPVLRKRLAEYRKHYDDELKKANDQRNKISEEEIPVIRTVEHLKYFPDGARAKFNSMIFTQRLSFINSTFAEAIREREEVRLRQLEKELLGKIAKGEILYLDAENVEQDEEYVKHFTKEERVKLNSDEIKNDPKKRKTFIINVFKKAISKDKELKKELQESGDELIKLFSENEIAYLAAENEVEKDQKFLKYFAKERITDFNNRKQAEQRAALIKEVFNAAVETGKREIEEIKKHQEELTEKFKAGKLIYIPTDAELKAYHKEKANKYLEMKKILTAARAQMPPQNINDLKILDRVNYRLRYDGFNIQPELRNNTAYAVLQYAASATWGSDYSQYIHGLNLFHGVNITGGVIFKDLSLSNDSMVLLQQKLVPRDRPEAVRWFMKAAGQNNFHAYYYLGYCYLFGEGVAKNVTQAIKYLELAAEKGHIKAQYTLGDYYKSIKEWEKSAKFFRLAAEQEHVRSQYELAELYAAGLGVEYNFQQMVVWYHKAAQHNYYPALQKLRAIYSDNKKITDKEYAVWYRESADNGDRIAQFIYGICHQRGTTEQKNAKNALYWMEKAGYQNITDAQTEVFLAYRDSIGIEKNLDRAMEWLKRAADSGSPKAKYLYANYLIFGSFDEYTSFDLNSGKWDNEEAFKYYKENAAKNHPESQYLLGYGLYHKKNIPQEGFHWFCQAAKNSITAAKEEVAKAYVQDESLKTPEQKTVFESLQYTAGKLGNKTGSDDFWDNNKKDKLHLLIAIHFYAGRGVEKNTVEAVKYLKKVVKKKDGNFESSIPFALYLLGKCYFDGDGVDKNLTFAEILLKKAVEKDPSLKEKTDKMLDQIDELKKAQKKSNPTGNRLKRKNRRRSRR